MGTCYSCSRRRTNSPPSRSSKLSRPRKLFCSASPIPLDSCARRPYISGRRWRAATPAMLAVWEGERNEEEGQEGRQEKREVAPAQTLFAVRGVSASAADALF